MNSETCLFLKLEIIALQIDREQVMTILYISL